MLVQQMNEVAERSKIGQYAGARGFQETERVRYLTGKVGKNKVLMLINIEGNEVKG